MLRRAGLRYLLRRPWLLGLSILGVALGVTVVVAIDLANASALRAFAAANEALTGPATHQILGGPRGVPESVYRQLRVDLGLRPSAPIVEGFVTVTLPQGRGSETVQLLGVDVFAELPFRSYLGEGRLEGDWEALLSEPAVALLDDVAARWGLRRGELLQVQAGAHRQALPVEALLRPARSLDRRALDGVLITDIATAQALLGMGGVLSRIDLVVAQADAAALARQLPAGVELLPAATRNYALEQITRAFRLNLTALSLLALVVGLFLIYNTMTFAVLQRREMIGTVRALGVTRGQVYRQALLEAAAIGGLGTALGIGGGIVLGDALLHLVTRTINDLYFVLQVRSLDLSPFALAKGVALGVGGSLAAGLLPALAAARTPPHTAMSRSLLEDRVRRQLPRLVAAALLAGAAGTGLLLLPTRDLVVGFAALFVIMLGVALLTPALVVLLARLLHRPMVWLFGLLGGMAARSVRVHLSRTGIAIAALALAISASLGVGLMIQSFRDTVELWLDNYMRADIYVAPAGPVLSPELPQRLLALPGVDSVSTGRRVDLPTAEGITQLFAIRLAPDIFGAFRLKEGDAAAARAGFYEGEGVLVSEPYAYRHRLTVGDSVRLRTERGPRSFPVVGVYYDYGSDLGYVTMYRGTYDRYWDDRDITSLGLYLAPGVDPDALVSAIRRAVGQEPVQVYSNRALREESLAVFDRTFAVTQVLRVLAILVAFVGILSALMAIQLERARELAVLRAVGLTPRQVWGVVGAETGLMGLCAGLLALPLGVLLSLLLVLVINRRSFGWSMELTVDPGLLAQALLLALGAALLAGLYPAYRMARTPPALALRGE